ncbi:hypothetical protein [Sulfurisphaera ohwakuensis]|uniref:NADH:ubiquinone oxidoreductase subunit 3 (Subunit A) n=1 Tax=Sulfurisphaera ohwakuensis TaxID=69656 RepID=A0A650CEM6_SULOH|nr:hypothetical protein [Sulfurisphaera ohwakuensis]MBB5252769.1 NADH:ubiquinone oxidoreductase subunit 3 (subunit A) [Sulfurisphaera ohwakuensis]QGR16290.1 hypothetical protein D1869_03045 [Sulfurisphaera ohwakuensis]
MKQKYYIAVFIALILDIVLYSVFPVYNIATPSIGGLPFFYVYQIIMLAVTAVIYLIVAFIKG